jgi:SAM-dependent methyltransferase
MTDFYSAIAERYDDIFPPDPDQAAFLASRLPPGSGRRVLDCGCATGSLAIGLYRAGFDALGIDLDPRLLEIARAKAEKLGADRNRLSFRLMDMSRAAEALPSASFSLVACLGNTLPHLSGPAAIEDCLRGFRGLLAPGGILALGLVDFRRIVESGSGGLPAIDNQAVRFERDYPGIAPGTPFSFSARLWAKPSPEPVSASTLLYPLYPDELDGLLSRAGFAQRSVSGGYRGQEPGSGFPSLVVVAARP